MPCWNLLLMFIMFISVVCICHINYINLHTYAIFMVANSYMPTTNVNGKL